MATRLTKHLLWTETGSATAPVSRARGFLADEAAALPFTALETSSEHPVEQQASLDIFTAPRDRAIYLMHVGAEVEHALMVQYLYAGYSLGGQHLTDPNHRRLTQEWKAKILEIAREEMGHLVTVENMLTLIGGPLSFEREDYPIPEDLYPFPFELEPLTKKSLGKYVLAEMPDAETIEKLGLTEEIEEIQKYVDGGSEKTKVNRVGILYAAILALFQPPVQEKDPKPAPPSFISSSDIQSSSKRFQVNPDEWGLGYNDILIETAEDRPSAINALQLIAAQGEGSTIGSLGGSHFGKFLEIYREFPDENGWQPSRNVARNPTTDSNAPADRYISNPVANIWAGLLNLRYRMLLMYLIHSFQIEAPLKASGRTPRGLLVSWAFGEMYNIRSITEILMTLPMYKDGGELLAGPPFEMPYSLALAARNADRWRMHRDLLLASEQYVEKLLKAGGGEYANYLKGLQSANESALAQVETLIGG
ncbi:MAG TPA: ferritin-like domain-containing protein [Pyrinomonadaceae bacterium]